MADTDERRNCLEWVLFFVDLEQLVQNYQEAKLSTFVTSSLAFDKALLDRFENAVKALQNVLPHLNQSNSVSSLLSEITHTLQLMSGVSLRAEHRLLLPSLQLKFFFFFFHVTHLPLSEDSYEWLRLCMCMV